LGDSASNITSPERKKERKETLGKGLVPLRIEMKLKKIEGRNTSDVIQAVRDEKGETIEGAGVVFVGGPHLINLRKKRKEKKRKENVRENGKRKREKEKESALRVRRKWARR